ncbi:MAG: hypothetical protein BMS9Abin26_1995 [Gammaproteobacteria bacterium]|nr:MAG: hypothetical protein BMS9Abin26_1995 [Gammaproteobacteria bacterium]
MASYKQVNSLNSSTAAYIAGLIDGEGSICLTRRHRNENRQLEVSISNTEVQLLEYVLKEAGAGRITRKRTYRNNHTPSATYIISNRQALDLLAQITRFLQTYKRKRSELILSDYIRLTPRNGKYNAELFAERTEFIDEFLKTKPGCNLETSIKTKPV